MSSTTITRFIIAVGLAVLIQAPAFSASPDPAASSITSLYGSLLDTMKQAKQLGLKGRFQKLSPCWPKPTISPRCRGLPSDQAGAR